MKINLNTKAELAQKISNINALSVVLETKQMLDYIAKFLTFVEIAEIIDCSQNYLYKIRIKNQEFKFSNGINSVLYLKIKKLYDELKRYENN